MKKPVQSSSLGSEENANLWTAEISLEQVQFNNFTEIGLDFYNSIDGWRKMEVFFRHKMTRPHIRRQKKNFSTLYYSIREKII